MKIIMEMMIKRRCEFQVFRSEEKISLIKRRMVAGRKQKLKMVYQQEP